MDASAQIEESLRPIIDEVTRQTTSLEDRLPREVRTAMSGTESSIYIPRLEGEGCLESAALLDTFVLLYDRVYWDGIHNGLLIPEEANNHPELHRFGVDQTFPDRLMEYMRLGIVAPIIDHYGAYSAPVESRQEAEMPQHLIYTRLPVLNWHDYPALFESYYKLARLLPASTAAKRHSVSSSAVMALMSTLVKSRALRTRNIYVANAGEEFQWKILAGIFGELLPQPATELALHPLSLLRLFEGLLLVSPCRLAVDDVLRLRQENATTRLRTWIAVALPTHHVVSLCRTQLICCCVISSISFAKR